MIVTKQRDLAMMPDVTIGDIFKGYKENAETNEVLGLSGSLNIRPAYQRQYFYDKDEATLVVDTVLHNNPIGIIYWAKIGEFDGKGVYEVLDGQQRIISLCRFMNNEFAVETAQGPRFFSELENQISFESYEPIIFVHYGTPEEKMNWFYRINKENHLMTEQEMRSAVYTGTGTSKAQKLFTLKSESVRTAYGYKTTSGTYARDYIGGKWERQDVYRTIIEWRLNTDEPKKINSYMSLYRNDELEADNLWSFYKKIMNFVAQTFPYDADMKKVNWGQVYHSCFGKKLAKKETINERLSKLEKLTEKIEPTTKYLYALSGQDDLLPLKPFAKTNIKKAYAAQGHKCAICGAERTIDELRPVRITSWDKGGTNSYDNLMLVCSKCHEPAIHFEPAVITPEKKKTNLEEEFLPSAEAVETIYADEILDRDGTVIADPKYDDGYNAGYQAALKEIEKSMQELL